jgi:hypothetical protein
MFAAGILGCYRETLRGRADPCILRSPHIIQALDHSRLGPDRPSGRPSAMRSPARFLLFVLLAIVGVKMSEQLYRFVAFRDERAQVRVLRDRLLDAGARLELARGERTRARDALEAEDARLEEERQRLLRLQRSLENGPVTQAQYDHYRAALETYNHHVVDRNGRYQQYQGIRDRWAASVESYAALADSMRDIATRMGEPYYSVPTPLEAAMARGVLKPEQ